MVVRYSWYRSDRDGGAALTSHKLAPGVSVRQLSGILLTRPAHLRHAKVWHWATVRTAERSRLLLRRHGNAVLRALPGFLVVCSFYAQRTAYDIGKLVGKWIGLR